MTVTTEAPGRQADARRIAGTRFIVHLALVASLVGAVVPLMVSGVLGRTSTHVIVASAFFGLAVVHLVQRRRTLGRLATQLVRRRRPAKARRRLAAADAVLLFLAANVLASGIWDYADGYKHLLLFLHEHNPGYHGASSLVFLGYLVAHVLRRIRRFRSSAIR